MFIKSLKIKNFKCFRQYEIIFEKINLLEGAIGVGKSTLIEAIIFALFGFSESILSDLPTRNFSKSCSVTLLLEDKGQLIEIIREFPLKLQIKEDNKILKMSTSEGNEYLCNRFENRQNWTQFRKIDAYNPEVNFLEQGTTTLKKILFGTTTELFNNVRNNLNTIKLERERLCKDDIVLSSCYPSEKRLEILNASLREVINTYKEIEGDISLAEEGLRESEIKLAENRQKISYLTKQINNIDTIRSSFDIKLRNAESRHGEIQRMVGDLNKQIEDLTKQKTILRTNKVCYVCKKPLDTENQKDLIADRNAEIDNFGYKLKILREEDIELCNNIPILKKSIIKERQQKAEDFKKEIEILEQEEDNYIEDIQNLKEIVEQTKQNRQLLLDKKEKIQTLRNKLENRLKQKQFIYTEKDIIIVKKAIEELDKLSSVYLVETIKSLEPIINSIVEKIGFQIIFEIDNKGKFNILLIKDEIQYKYSDLSCGQRLILQIALKLSLLLQQNKSGIIVSDEGLSALENNNLEDIVNLFKELSFQLVFVLHRASIEDPEINIIKIGGNNEKETE